MRRRLVVLVRDFLQRKANNERERGEFIAQNGVQNVGYTLVAFGLSITFLNRRTVCPMCQRTVAK